MTNRPLFWFTCSACIGFRSIMSAQVPVKPGLYDVTPVVSAKREAPAFSVFSGQEQHLAFSMVAPFSGRATWIAEGFQKSGSTLMPLPGVIGETNALSLSEGNLFNVLLPVQFPETRGEVEVLLRVGLKDADGKRHMLPPPFLVTVTPPKEVLIQELTAVLGLEKQTDNIPVQWFGVKDSVLRQGLEQWNIPIKDTGAEGPEVLDGGRIWFGEFYPEDSKELMAELSAFQKSRLVVCWDDSDPSSPRLHFFTPGSRVTFVPGDNPDLSGPRFLKTFIQTLKNTLPPEETSL